jgi:hypothetical protein
MAYAVRDHGPAQHAPQQQLRKPSRLMADARYRDLVTHFLLLW